MRLALALLLAAAQTVIQISHLAPPDSLAGYVQRSDAIVLGQVTKSVQKGFGDPPFPYIDHEVKVLRVIKDDGIVGKHKAIQVGQSGGVVVSQGVTYRVEPTDKPLGIHEKLILFLITKDAGAAAYLVPFGWGAFYVGKAIDKSDVVQIPRLPEFKGALTMDLDAAISKLKSAVKAGRGSGRF